MYRISPSTFNVYNWEPMMEKGKSAMRFLHENALNKPVADIDKLNEQNIVITKEVLC